MRSGAPTAVLRHRLFSEYINRMDKNRGGRPPKPEGERLVVPVVVRLTRELRDKLTRLGGPAWLRERIKAAKEPQSKE